MMLLYDNWLRRWTTVVTASLQNTPERHLDISMLHAIPTILWLRCSMMPFCWGEYQSGELMLYSQLGAVLVELRRCELSSAVHVERHQILSRLPLCGKLNVLDRCHRDVLGWQQRYPHVAGVIIDKEEEVYVTTWCLWRDWDTQVSVQQPSVGMGHIIVSLLGKLHSVAPPN
jgi:hypothetical protein